MLPGVWVADDISRMPPDSRRDWDRLSEMWYETYSDFMSDVFLTPPKYTRPDWAMSDDYLFLKPCTNFVFTLLLERPNDNFLKSDIF